MKKLLEAVQQIGSKLDQLQNDGAAICLRNKSRYLPNTGNKSNTKQPSTQIPGNLKVNMGSAYSVSGVGNWDT